MSKVIFCDFHHSGLAYAMHLLFEKRLGYELYFPIGVEWFDKGYWGIAEPYDNSPDTIKQYLDLDHKYIPRDGTQVLNEIKTVQTNYYEVYDHSHGYTRKAITWDQFMSMRVDIILASIPRHWEMYRQLRDIYKPLAKVICHMGNMFEEVEGGIKTGCVRNLMASTIEFNVPSWVNKVFYHQEVDQKVYSYEKPNYDRKPYRITSFVNCLPRPDLYEKYKHALPGFEFKSYGGGCEDGCVGTIQEMARHMKDSLWAYHIKPYGDGFGHVWFDWAFVGRPIITNFADYEDKLGGEIFEDGVTGIDIGKHSFAESVRLIQEISNDPNRHLAMCEEIYRRVKQKVNYQKELKDIKNFLENFKETM